MSNTTNLSILARIRNIQAMESYLNKIKSLATVDIEASSSPYLTGNPITTSGDPGSTEDKK